MITYLISLTLISLAVIIVRAIFRHSVSQRAVYALWLVVLIRICLPYQLFALELPEFFERENTEQSATTEAKGTAAKPQSDNVVTGEPAPPYGTGSNVPSPNIPASTAKPADPAVPEVPATSISPSGTHPSETSAPNEGALPGLTPASDGAADIRWTGVLCVLWAAGSGIFALTLALCAIAFWRRLRADRKYFTRLGRTKVYISANAGSPMIWGLVPSIYLTPDSVGGEQYSLLHERTHLRHGDHIWSILRAAVLVAFWWNPLIWAAAILSKRDAELACDEAVSSRLDEKGRIEYASVIIDNIPKRRTLATGLASAPIKERIIMITRKNKTRILSLFLAIALVTISLGCSFIGKEEPQTDDPGGFDIAKAAKTLDERLGKNNIGYCLVKSADGLLFIAYVGQGSEPSLYFTSDGNNFETADIEIPDDYAYNNAEIAYIYPDRVVVELEYRGVYTYIEYNISEEAFDGVLSEDECYFVDYLDFALDYMKFPCANFPIKYGTRVGPFVGHVEGDASDNIDIYTEKDGVYIASIPWETIADFPAMDREEKWLNGYSVWYGEIGDFRWAVIAGGAHLGSDNRNFCISHDGGKTWETGDGSTIAGLTSCAIFVSDKIGLMGYYQGAYEEKIVIARTEDGGKSWNRVKIALPEDFPTIFHTITPVAFDYDGNVCKCTLLLRGTEMSEIEMDIVSSDGGLTWQPEDGWKEKTGEYHLVVEDNGTRDSHLVLAAMYGNKTGDAYSATSYVKATEAYLTTLHPGNDTDFYAVYGRQNDYKTQGDFDGYVTYHIRAVNGRIISSETVDTITKADVLAYGKPYEKELWSDGDGYPAKAFSRGDGITSYAFSFEGENGIKIHTYRGGYSTYAGTYTYDSASGTLAANVRQEIHENGEIIMSEPQAFSGKLYEYGGFVRFICEQSDSTLVKANDPLPISFKMREKPTEYETLRDLVIGAAVTEKYLESESIGDADIVNFIINTAIYGYVRDGYRYSKYWKEDGEYMYVTAEDAAYIAYEAFGADNYKHGKIRIPRSAGVGGSGIWYVGDSAVTEQNGDTVKFTCSLRGDGLSVPHDKIYGTYTLTFRYITEGENSFWRFEGIEKADDFCTEIAVSYGCKEAYFSDSTPTYGEFTLNMPIDTDRFEVDFDVRFCGDGCAYASLVSLITQGYAPVTKFVLGEEYASDKNGYRIMRFDEVMPEEMESETSKESELANKGHFLLDIGEGYYAYIGIRQKDGTVDRTAMSHAVETARVGLDPLSF